MEGDRDEGSMTESPIGNRCKAMMEITLKENGKWSISKLEIVHNHSLTISTSSGSLAETTLSIGMLFDSVEAAKIFYYAYGDKLGFKARIGSNRRSAGTGALIMQRFLCWRWSYSLQKMNLEMGIGKRKRGPYKKRDRQLVEVEEKKNDYEDAIEVIAIDSLAEKVADVERRPSVKNSVELDSMSLVRITPLSHTNISPFPEERNGVEPIAASSVSAHSMLLRELGVRVYRYSSDEKRDIILRYLMKKNSRQSSERTIKFFTTQPPPGDNFWQQQTSGQQINILQQQEAGAKIIGRLPLQDKAISRNPKSPTREIISVIEEPKIGMLFTNEDRAYQFYVRYAEKVGFCVRKGWWDKTARSVTRLRVYVCSKEGFRPKNFVNEMKKLRPEARTGCPARMAIKLMLKSQYSVSEFVSEHNHELAAPLDIQMYKSQKLSTKVLLGNSSITKMIPAEYSNYLRIKPVKSMQMRDVKAMLKYFQRMKSKKPSFFCAMQVDEDDQFTNFFWADTNSIVDYDNFGDVVCFDTTYKDANFGRPFVRFIGVNHHKQCVVFGAAVIYSETVESFKWLFETFKAAMGDKQPKTILSGQSAAMSVAITVVWPGIPHRYCVWHLYQNAEVNLAQVFNGTETFSFDFRQCIFEFHEEEDFLNAWTFLLERYSLKDNEWLAKLYDEREKWALPYGQDIFYADIFSTLQKEGVNSMLKEYLNPEVDFLQFLAKYEVFLKQQRCLEQEADYLTSHVSSGEPTPRFLWQAANMYTPAAFDMFKMEFDLIVNCLVYTCGVVGTISEYEVAVKDKSKLYFIRFDISDGSVFCSCKKFELVGIQCCHALKVLDCRNVKDLASRYFIKRWRKNAKSELFVEDGCFLLQADLKPSLKKRYSSLCRILYKLAARAAENGHAFAFMENQSDQILEQVERILQTKLLEKTSMSASSKSHSQSLQHEGISNDKNDNLRRLSGKKKESAFSRRQQIGIEMSNKLCKGRKGKANAVEISVDASDPMVTSNEIPSHVGNSSNHFFPLSQSVQATYVHGQQFGLGSFHGFHGTPQFTQEFSAPVLQQRSFPADTHLGQASEMHSLQYAASNSQLGPQDGGQGHYIPVWDFL